MISVLSLCLCASVVLFPSRARAEFMAGAAKVEITPDVKTHHVPLGGYAARRGAPSTGVHDPVYARALALSDGKIRAAVVSVDLCFLPANVAEDVLQQLEKKGVHGYEGAHLFLAATHTHSAPDPLAIHAGNSFKAAGWTSYDAWLRGFIAERIAEAVIAADRRLAPAQLGYVSVEESSGLNRNRRGFPVVDHALTVMKAVDRAGWPIAEVVDFAAHPTLYDDDMMEVSADWPGVMEGEIEKKAGDKSVCLFLNGAEGDASPNGMDQVKPNAEKVLVYGKRVAATAEPLLDQVKPTSDPPLQVWMQKVTLPPRKPNALFLLAAAQLGLDMKSSRGLVDALMPAETHLRFIRIGDLLLIGFPCEPSGALGIAAKEEAQKKGFTLPVVVALVDEWLGYGLTPEQYRAGKYESVMSFYGDQFGPALLTGLRDGLNTPPAGQ